MRKFYVLVITLLLVSPIFRLHAQEVDILWQGKTYTPPFYKGKTLWSSQSKIALLAIPHISGAGNPVNLTYKWIKNGTVLGNINGVGKNTLAFTDSILSKPQTIKVEILSSSPGTVLASASVTITPVSPMLAIYENNPLYGFMFHREISGTYELREQEVTLTAFPLFFSAASRMTDSLSYQWRSNDGGVETSNSVTYRAPEDARGASAVSAEVSHEDKILQSSGKHFLIQFGNQQDE